MGAFTQRLIERMRDKRPRLKWPRGHHGAVMWCEHCGREVLRIPSGQEVTIGGQKMALEAHGKTCRGRR